jgi:hypothetical protein
VHRRADAEVVVKLWTVTISDETRDNSARIPTFASVREDAVWAAAFVRHLTGGGHEARRHADRALEQYRDAMQLAEMPAAPVPSEEGPAHV